MRRPRLLSNVTMVHVNHAIYLSLVVIQFTYKSVLANAGELTNEESSFRDPIVWDSRSLYKTSTKSNEQLPFRYRRSATTSPQQNNQPLVDACQSKMEILTPYYATNSKGKPRIVVNSELMQQAIQVETCTRTSISEARCSSKPDCGCEQKYKWHRLLVSDPSEAGMSKGLFMDWFLFPSSCNCRCRSSPGSSKQFLRATMRQTSG